MRRFIHRLLSVFRHHLADAELDRELASHLSLLEDEYRRRGSSDAGARLAARRAMGSVALAKDLHRDARAFAWLDDLRQDLCFSVRLLRRDPVFTTIAVLTLGFGMIGASTAIFSLVNGVLVRPLPYEGSERLVRVAEYFPPSGTGSPLAPRTLITGAELEALQSVRTLSNVGIYGGRPFSMTLARPQGAVRLAGEQVSPAVFPMLRARPILGRVFEPREDTPGSDAVVILSYAAWLQHFGARDDIVGRVLSFDGTGYTVVGVMPRGFEFPDAQSVFWVPLVRSAATGGQDTGVSMARIANGRTRHEAIAEVSAILSRMRSPREPAAGFDGPRFDLLGLRDEMVAPVRTALVVLGIAAGIVLFLACTNVASLLLARATTRQRELAVRVAIGASRARLVRQALTESMTLALLGGLAGTGLAVGLVRLLRALGTSLPRRDLYLGTGVGIPRLDEVGVDTAALAFAVLASLLTGVMFGLAPALRQARLDSVHALCEAPCCHRVRRVLVAAELSMAMMLLVGGGLLVHSFIKLTNVDPGYEASKVAWFQAFLPRERSASLATLDSVATMDQLLSNATSRPRFYAVWFGIFALMSVLLAVIGLYGLMSYAVAQRTPEIGIRVALGAQRHEVMGLVLRESVMMTAAGISMGLAGAAAFTRYLEGMLFALTPLDPVTFAAVAVLFAALAMLASYVPARRAAQVDPLVALRSE